MKKRVTIYVEEDVWKDIRVAALNAGESAGDYLVGFHESLVENTKPVKPATYEHKDLVAEIPVEIQDAKITAKNKSMIVDAEGYDSEQAKLELANERLLKKRTEIKGAIKTASDLPNRYQQPEFKGGVPKAKWKGAK